ncbi:oleoyl-acyl carrier protein thioesterase 1, chloroplastic-like [Panicum miliaceum]|uniref:Acyl-[acyl-carrier-protein] hydrolase n=1 Tax=Panicum miliaceum TaxID=4540 RepID=A0A3L6TA14_PANMI|nr:oleoyl-acyl carrier protein thioesterase 1, chloroplastic-like [Panicum miliaceum]
MAAAKIAPSILSSDFANLDSEAERMLRLGADWLHMDIMDGLVSLYFPMWTRHLLWFASEVSDDDQGLVSSQFGGQTSTVYLKNDDNQFWLLRKQAILHFVPNLTIGAPVIQSLRKHTKAYLDRHLMVTNPSDYIEPFGKAGASGFAFHIEVARDGRIGTRRDWILKDLANGEVIGRATSKWVMMNQNTRRLQRVSDDVRDEVFIHCPKTPRLAFPEENNGNLKNIPILSDPAQYSRLGLVPRRADLDMNQHVNNVTYIGWVLEKFLRTPDSAVLLAAYNPPCYYATRNKKMNKLNTPTIVQTEPTLSKQSLQIVAMECTDQILKIPTTKVHRFTIYHDSPYNMSLGYKQHAPVSLEQKLMMA